MEGDINPKRRWISTGIHGATSHKTLLTLQWGRAIVQAVSPRLPTAGARVRSQVRSCGICGGQSGTGTCFLRVLRIPLPILIPPTTPHSSSIMRGQMVADVPSGHSLTPPQESKKKKKKLFNDIISYSTFTTFKFHVRFGFLAVVDKQPGIFFGRTCCLHLPVEEHRDSRLHGVTSQTTVWPTPLIQF
jgi:hypothetical protein